MANNINKKIKSPVVGIFGHIDHGKSTLIDYIRNTNVTGKEAGGITQHVSAYEIRHHFKDGRDAKLTIIDTPGHEAFSGTRNRGANVADIAVLVVSAEDGVKPQTLEVYKDIKESAIPYLVAITKIDKPTADIIKTKQSLAENGIYVEGFGGDTPVVELSATTGHGVDDFLEMIALLADLNEKTGDEEKLGEGVIIESKIDSKRGISAVGIIKDGTVRKGLFASTEGAVAPVRFILDSEDNMVDELSFSSPIQIVGWNNMPKIGTLFKTFLKKEEALDFAQIKEDEKKTKVIQDEDSEKSSLPLVIKADTAGGLEALEGEIRKTETEKIAPKIIFGGVGSINENDIKMIKASGGGYVVGFNTKIDQQAKALAERSDVEVITSKIIYELTDEVRKILQAKEPKIETEESIGEAKIVRIFSTAKNKQVVGGKVSSGMIEKGTTIKISRREAEIGRGRIKELQKAKIATSNVNAGEEFGALVESKIELAPGDIIESVNIVIK